VKRWIVVLFIIALLSLGCPASDDCAAFERSVSQLHVDCRYNSSSAHVVGTCSLASAVVGGWALGYSCITGTTVAAAGDGYSVSWTMSQ